MTELGSHTQKSPGEESDHRSSHGSHNSAGPTDLGKSERLPVITGVVLVGLAAMLALNYMPGVEKTFSLSDTDIVMILVCSFLFIMLWAALEKVLFAPFLSLVEAREGATVGAEERAVSYKTQAQELRIKYESLIYAARVEAMERKLTRISQAKTEASRIIERAEDEAQEALRKVRWDLVTNMKTIRAEALREAETLSGALLKRLGGGTSIVVILVLIAGAFFPNLAFASDAEHASSGIGSLGWPFANFVLYIVIMYKLLAKPLKDALIKRRENIVSYVDQAAAKEREAHNEFTQVSQLLAGVNEEIAELKRRIAEEAEHESQSILEAAGQRAERIEVHGRESSIAEQKATETMLRKELAELVVKLAEEKVRSALTVEGDRELRARAVTRVKQLRN